MTTPVPTTIIIFPGIYYGYYAVEVEVNMKHYFI